MAIDYDNSEDRQTQLLEGMQVSQSFLDNRPFLEEEEEEDGPTVNKLPPINIPAPLKTDVPEEEQLGDPAIPYEELGGTLAIEADPDLVLSAQRRERDKHLLPSPPTIFTGAKDLGPTYLPPDSSAERRYGHKMPVDGVAPVPTKMSDIAYDAKKHGIGAWQRGEVPLEPWEMPSEDNFLPYGLAPNLGDITNSGLLSRDQLAIQKAYEEDMKMKRIQSISKGYEGYVPGEMHWFREYMLGDNLEQ